MALNGIIGIGAPAVGLSAGAVSVAAATRNTVAMATEPSPLSPDWEKRRIALLWGAADLHRRGIPTSHRALGAHIGYSPATIGLWKKVLKRGHQLPEDFGARGNGKVARASLSKMELAQLWKGEIELRVARLTTKEVEVNLTTVTKGFGCGVEALLLRLKVLREENLWPEGMPEPHPGWFSRSNGNPVEESKPTVEGSTPPQGHRSGFSFRGPNSSPSKVGRKTAEQALASLDARIKEGARLESQREKRVALLTEAFQTLDLEEKPVTLESLALELKRTKTSVRIWIQEAKLANLLPFGFPMKL